MKTKSRISVIVNGAMGKMGSTVISAVDKSDDMKIVGAVDVKSKKNQITLPYSGDVIEIKSSFTELLDQIKPNVIVDFTNGNVANKIFIESIKRGISVVSGSTGLSDKDLTEISTLAANSKIGCLHASNFAIGAVLLMHLASIASSYFDYVDLIESHHEMKIDAPSGTAISIAKAIVNSRGRKFESNDTLEETLKGTRGGIYEGVNIHSARIPGRVARHEVVFGGPGQTLTMLHDSINRESFMPGVLMGIRKVIVTDRLIVGLDDLLDLK